MVDLSADCKLLKSLHLQTIDVSDMENFFSLIEKPTYQTIATTWNFLLSSGREVDHKEFGCSVCWETDTSEEDLIIICDVCQLRTHQSCYGVPFIPSGGWVCESCSLLLSNVASKNRECILCPKDASCGPLKRTSTFGWAHCLCCRALQGEIEVKNDEFFDDINTENIDNRRWKLVCMYCRIRQGTPVQCSEKGCYFSFHPYCALENGCGLTKENWAFKCETHKTAVTCHRSSPSRDDHQNIHFLSRLPISVTEGDMTSASHVYDIGSDPMILFTRYRIAKKIMEQALRTPELLTHSSLSEKYEDLSTKRDLLSHARVALTIAGLVEKIEKYRHALYSSYFQLFEILLLFETRSYIDFCRNMM